MLYNAPYGVTDPNAPYINGNPATGTAGSIPPASSIEYPQREIVNAEVAAGLIPTNTDLTQLTQAIKLLGRLPFVQDQGATNHIVVNPVPFIPVYAMPLIMAVEVAFTNTGPVDINVSGLGPIPLRQVTGSDLNPNDLQAGGIGIVAYDGAKFQLISVPGSLQYPTPDKLWHYGVDFGTVNHIQVTVDNRVTNLINGLPLAVLVGNTNTGATNIVVNGIGPVPTSLAAGSPIPAGAVVAGYIALFVYDGTEFQLLNPASIAGTGGTGNDITGPDRPYWLAVNSTTLAAQPGSPALGDTYMIPTGSTGPWSGLSGRLTQWNGTAWVYRAYPSASIIGASDSMRFYENVGGNVWSEIQFWSLGKALFYCQL